MKIFKSKDKLQKEIFNNKTLSFVPTMGGFHKGHVSLIKRAKNYKGQVLVSIYVNPKQFNEKKDFINYPRNIKKDLNILNNLKVDLVFMPNYNDIYSFKSKKNLYLHKFSKKLCGKYRKNHFKGVVNVVNRFIEIIKPKHIFLGKKDFQQLYLIDKHLKKNKIKTSIISCKTIRELNGVACSSRNFNLEKKHMKVAASVYKFLKKRKAKIKKNLKHFNFIDIKSKLINLGVEKIDYINLYNLKSFKKPINKKENFNIFIAYHLNKVRLIDNI